MLQKTEMSEASTNAEAKTASFYTSRAREMFREAKRSDSPGREREKEKEREKGVQLPNDLILLQPEAINNLAWPEIFLFENDLRACIKDSFYEVGGMRGGSKFLPRRAEPNAELVFFWSENPRKTVNLISIERYMAGEKGEERLSLHLNLTKYDPEANSAESADFHLLCDSRNGKTAQEHEVWDFRAFEAIESCRKGVLIVHVLSRTGEQSGLYRVMLVDLVDRRKPSEVSSLSKSQLRVLSSAELFCEVEFGRQSERLIKTIKSEFGDIILVVTSKEIYEVEVEEVGEGHKLALKAYKLSKTIAGTKDNYLKSEGLIREGKERTSANAELILDAQFVSNGLKIMLLTNYQQVIFIEGHNFLFSQALPDTLAASNIAEKYKLDAFRFTHLHSINGSLAVEFQSANGANLLYQGGGESAEKEERVTQGFLLLKPQSNYLAFGKVIGLPFQSKEVLHRSVHGCHGVDEILIQYIERRNPHSLKVIRCRILMAELNAIVRLHSLEYAYPRPLEATPALLHFHPAEPEKRYSHCEVPLSSRVFFFLNEKELCCYKFFSELDAQRTGRQMRKLFSHGFFERPVKLAISPLTMHCAVVFREFVRFFHFNYLSLKNYFTLKLKHVVDLEYVNRGAQLLLTTAEGYLYLLDAYSFQEQKLMEVYGEPAEVKMIDEKHLLVRSSKHLLTLYRSGWDEEADAREFSKVYEVRLEEGDHFIANLQHLLLFRKNAQMEVYNHSPFQIPSDWPQAERECYAGLQSTHRHLVNRLKCGSFLPEEVPTKVLLSEQLGFLLVGTSRGNVKEYLWPLQRPSNPNPPSVFTQQVASSRIIGLSLDAKYSFLYAVSESGSIAQLALRQFINGQAMPYVYIFSEKTREAEQQKREFTDRNYFIDNYAPTEGALTQAAVQTQEELEFFIDKLKDDLEEMTKNLLFNGRQREADIKRETRACQEDFKKTLKLDEGAYSSQLQQIRTQLELNDRQVEAQRAQEEEQYQRKLLQLYRESDRLKQILRSQDQKLTEEKRAFQREFAAALQAFEREKEEEVAKLEAEYRAIEERRRLSERQNEILDREEEAEMAVFKAKVHEQEEGELRGEEEYKERLLGENAKKEKAINNLKHRGNYFENLILETRVQINELKRDQGEYEKKKEYLREELKDKEEIIEKIEKELVLYLRNTEDMKTIKNNHQFELNEYQREVAPIQDDFRRIEDNVKHMNQEIMKEYNLKVEKGDAITHHHQHILALKQTKKALTIRKLEQQAKLRRLIEKLTELAEKAFEVDLKQELKAFLGEGDSAAVSQDEARERLKKEGERLLRYKNMVRKEIQEEEKREEHVIKNQHEFYKYHLENTTLVREFNDLKKTQKILADDYHRLADKLAAAKLQRVSTPLKRVPSINLRKAQEKKLTPFQKYEEETSANARKNQDTTDTKLSRNSQSLSFLKGLMKEVNQTDSKYEKMEVMRERVRTFVNPELKSKPEDIKKLLFGRTRGTSEMLKLK